MNVILFSCIYIFIFSGYYLVVGFLNLLYFGIWPQISFVIFYAVYSLSSLIAPFISHKIKLDKYKIILFCSAITYLFFIGFAGSLQVYLLLIGSALAGVGNGFIWLGQGLFLDGEQMGLFYSLFNINLILGNLVGLLILIFNLSVQIMVLSMLAVTGIGVFLIIFLPRVSNENNDLVEDSIWKVFLVSKNCYLLFLIFIYQAVGLNVTYQIIPRLLLSNTIESTNNKDIYNAAIFIAYGISAMIFSYIWGKLFSINWQNVVYPYTVLEIICLFSIFFLSIFNNRAGYYIIIGFLRGIIDYGVNNTINITLSHMIDKQYYFGLYRFVYSLSYLVTSICIAYIPYQYVLLICGIFCLASSLSYYFYQKMMNKISNKGSNNISNLDTSLSFQFENNKILL